LCGFTFEHSTWGESAGCYDSKLIEFDSVKEAILSSLDEKQYQNLLPMPLNRTLFLRDYFLNRVNNSISTVLISEK
jgi:hypothetical protein